MSSLGPIMVGSPVPHRILDALAALHPHVIDQCEPIEPTRLMTVLEPFLSKCQWYCTGVTHDLEALLLPFQQHGCRTRDVILRPLTGAWVFDHPDLRLIGLLTWSFPAIDCRDREGTASLALTWSHTPHLDQVHFDRVFSVWYRLLPLLRSTGRPGPIPFSLL